MVQSFEQILDIVELKFLFLASNTEQIKSTLFPLTLYSLQINFIKQKPNKKKI